MKTLGFPLCLVLRVLACQIGEPCDGVNCPLLSKHTMGLDLHGACNETKDKSGGKLLSDLIF
ncbi:MULTISPECIES: hypothetical protein [unclassified Saccharicrinis]|uniref:hypothetical protein n=1 Tax=unclassified Saccharicrinis TaxID=2646859 RepID=UPI003D32B5F2